MRKHLNVVLNDLCISKKKEAGASFFLDMGYGTLRYWRLGMGRFAIGYWVWDMGYGLLDMGYW